MKTEWPSQVVRARLQLMLSEPYLATALTQLPLVDATDSEWCESMATDGFHIFVDLPFCESLDEDQLMFVLAHELMHCILGHMDRCGDRIRVNWNMAVDYATNLLLVEMGLTMPLDGLFDEHYSGMTAEEIYDALPARASDPITFNSINALETAGGYPTPGEVSAARCNSQATLRRPEHHPAGKQHQSHLGHFEFSDKGSDQQSPRGFDMHLAPDDQEGLPMRMQSFPTPDERKRLRKSLVKSAAGQLAGTQTGCWKSEIEAATSSRVPWEHVLSYFVSGLRRTDYRLYPFNRRHLWRGLYLPSIGVPGPDHLVLAIDTSASMDEELLSRVLAELDHLRGMTETTLTIIQCDTEITHVEEFTPYEPSAFSTSADGQTTYRFYGRGGTDLCPPFEWVETQMHEHARNIDALIYFTDGYGPSPTSPPPIPVLWLVPENGATDFSFGQVIRI
jgi:predicted metal-dependent peptidase